MIQRKYNFRVTRKIQIRLHDPMSWRNMIGASSSLFNMTKIQLGPAQVKQNISSTLFTNK